MKQVLSQLHNIINELQNNNLVKEAEVLDQVFTKLAGRTVTLDASGEPDMRIVNYNFHVPEDETIHKSKTYKKLRTKWLQARQAYVASKALSYIGSYTNQNKFISMEQARFRERQLRAKWIKAEDDLITWYEDAYKKVKAGKPVPEIQTYQVEDITDEVNNRKKLIPLQVVDITDEVNNRKKPAVNPTKQITEPQQNAPSQPMAKPVAKPSAQKPQVVKKELQEQVMPTQNNLTQDQIYFKAQMHFVNYEAKIKELGSKEQAYRVMQAEVYNSDKTKGKQIYKEWLKFVNPNAAKTQEKKTPEYTYKPLDSTYTPYGTEFEAQQYFDEYKSKIDAFGSKSKAYDDMQAKVYNADKTKGKQIYKEWQKLVDSESV